ncbi:GspH/FimT family pseudopilin [Thermosediminibacter litoriperuensis]|uniref:Type IV fimbrial biogenesis protein FimT n=1 Tax=Thermosediminibacter litoriperuensis TaxID=291989 RepID=A0A5S5ANE1_9FIRM|nr:GspH/FimT family pseudopilin [Thermosediminibacter litoriperuensis]TYP51616.1 type IV fimbrial biogenesis protein FimT [Thermosediminibacter litoriperuensis]
MRGTVYRRGFTLIETIAVTAILGILCLITVPSIRTVMDNFKLQVAAQKLVQDMRAVQQQAMAEGESYKILFDMHRCDNYQILHGYRASRVYLPEGISLSWTNFSKNTLIFTPSGAPEQGGTVAIKGAKGRLYVVVTVATGRVRISETAP